MHAENKVTEQVINGKILRDAMISGANNIAHYKQQVDALNVFPVPDGDTGTNMSMTIGAAARELVRIPESASAEDVAKTAASALLRGARGNSGVILSLLFRGFSKGLKGKTEADGADLAQALDMGVKAAYKAVMKPTEGTILTVARLAAEKAAEAVQENTDPLYIWEQICQAAQQALEQTPQMLPVLQKAGVVDAGGQGLVYIFKGMLSVIKDGKILVYGDTPEEAASTDSVKTAAGQMEQDIHFAYCTEFIVQKENQDDPALLRTFLESIGDCVVVVDDEEIIKVHVHTNNPGDALQAGLKHGSLTNMKIENMRQQHTAQVLSNQQVEESATYAPADPGVPYGFVAVAAGEGIKSLFMDLGVNQVVSGGQTMNPSTDDILKAIEAVPAQTVFVLPNNKNIIMAAEQAIKLADRKVCVLQTKTIPQGISAMLAFDPEADTNDNLMGMTAAYEQVQTGQITFAARDSDFDGHKIKEGELLALHNGKLAFTEKDLLKASVKLAKALVKKDCSFMTLLYGAQMQQEEAEKIQAAIAEKLGDEVEITLINGGQPVYYLILSAE